MVFRTPALPSTARKMRPTAESVEEQENKATDSRANSLPPNKQPRRPISGQPASRLPTGGAAGAVSDDYFQQCFSQVPKVEVFTAKELSGVCENLRTILGNPSVDWDKRVDALKRLRSVLIGGGENFDELDTELKLFEAPLLAAVKDLRSQVVREVCITIAFYAERLEQRMSRLAEALLPGLISLLQNSAKVMSSSAFVACSTLLKNVQSSKMIPIIFSSLTSKSKEIRRACFEFVAVIIGSWSAQIVEKSMPTLCEGIRLGLNDADADARSAARNAFQSLENLYKLHAATLFQSLDPSKQRALSGHMSRSTSNQSIASERDAPPVHRPAVLQKAYLSGRSSSEIDPTAARRALQRHTPSRIRATPLQPLNSTPYRSPRTPVTPLTRTRIMAIPNRQSPVLDDNSPSKSISQPGSRSNSPTSRLPVSARKTRTSLGGRSNDGSREQSPTRSNAVRPLNGAGRREMERAVTDAFKNRLNGHGSDDTDDTGGDRYRRFDSAELSDALRCCLSTQWTEKRDALHVLQRLIRQSSFTQADLKRITDTLNRLFFDSNNKALGTFLETVVELVNAYRSQLGEWMYVLIGRLISKAANELLPSAQTHVQQALAAVRSSFDPQMQLLSLCKFIQDPMHTHTVKVKIGILNYMHQLMENMNSAAMMNKAEVRQAVNRLILWIDDPKSTEVSKLSVQVLCDMFQLNASEFSSILATFPEHSRNTVFGLLKQHQLSNGSSGLANTDLVHHRLRETSAQITEYVLGAANGRSNGKDRNGLFDSPFSMQKLSEETSSIADSMLDDSKHQQQSLSGICQLLSMHNQRVPERLRAFDDLSLLTRDPNLAQWEEHFKTVLLLLIETLGDSNPDIRANALRLLKELCMHQAIRFRPYSELTVLRVLEAHRETEKEVLRRAEECASALAGLLPAHICLRVLVPVIVSGDLPRQLGAIKMLTKLLAEMSSSDLQTILPDVVPGVVNAYNNEDSGVRKASVLCLVVLHNGVGEEPLTPYLASLNSSKMKLLKLYITRNQTASGTQLL